MARILLIDDDPMVMRTVRKMLEHAGHEVVEARNGREGEAAYDRAPADLVITDILMPEQEGIETIINLRRRHPAVRLLAMSGLVALIIGVGIYPATIVDVLESGVRRTLGA